MCFYFSNSRRALDLVNRYGRKAGIIEMSGEAASGEIQEAQYRVSAFTHPACPLITTDENIETAKWGLIPTWKKTIEERRRTPMATLGYLQLISKIKWSLSNLVALLRQQLFVYRDLIAWLNKPKEGPPQLAELVQLSFKFSF